VTERQRDLRNLNPHKPAMLAMRIYCNAYARQNGGSMDFWDSLAESTKQRCRDLVKEMDQAPPEVNQRRP